MFKGRRRVTVSKHRPVCGPIGLTDWSLLGCCPLGHQVYRLQVYPPPLCVYHCRWSMWGIPTTIESFWLQRHELLRKTLSRWRGVGGDTSSPEAPSRQEVLTGEAVVDFNLSAPKRELAAFLQLMSPFDPIWLAAADSGECTLSLSSCHLLRH